MKKFYFLILFVFFATVSFGQNSTHDTTLVKNVIIESFDEIWSELNAENIDKFYTKDFLLLENGMVWNNDTIVNYITRAKLEKKIPTRINSFEFIEIKVSGKTAWIAYHNYATFSIDNNVLGNVHWLESATAILTEKGWKLNMLHSTRVNKK